MPEFITLENGLRGGREKEWHIQRVIDTKVPIDIVTAATAAAVS